MSLTSTQSLFQYSIASLGQAFIPACPIQNTSDFVLTYTNATTKLDTVLTLNVDYTVTGSATAGVILAPTVTLEASGLHYAVGGTLTIQRKNPFTQPTTYVDGNKYLAATPNNSLDWLAYSIQALNDITNRSLRVPASNAAFAEMTITARLGKLLGFDTNGGVQFYDPASAVFATGTHIETASIAALKAVVITGFITGQQAMVAGYYATNDGGGGLFTYNSASAATDNGGTIIAPNAGSGRWLRASPNNRLNVRQFGAKGDNSTNDTAAISAAFTLAVATPGASIYVPPGTYLTDNIALASVNGLTIYGDGMGVSILKGTHATRILSITASTRVNVRGITVDGQCTARTAGQQAVTMDCSKSSFTCCEIINSGEFAFFAGDQSAVTELVVSNNYIHDCYADGIHFEWVSTSLIENNLILRVDDDCIALYYNGGGLCNGITVIGNYCSARNDLGTTTGRGIVAIRTINSLISTNFINGVKQDGIRLHNETGSRVSRVRVVNNTVKLCCIVSGNGIVAYATSDCTLEGNVVDNPITTQSCIDIADWQNLVIKGGILRQENNMVCRGIHAEESAGWAASWDNLVIADVVIQMLAANNIQCIYLGPNAAVTMNIVSISGIVGNMVTAGDYISVVLARLGTLAKVVNNIKLQAANTISPAASSGVLTVANNN